MNYQSIAKLFINSPKIKSFVPVQLFHQSSVVNKKKKYHDVYTTIHVHKEKMKALEARYERLDVEDRPTGCLLCPHRNPEIELDYKNVRLLSQFVSPHTGKIYGSRITGLCPNKQRELAQNIRRARKVGLMPVTMKYFDYHSDPKLF
uniref:28S ribosomal protein S18c,mitochondrial n=1 Tax=Hydra vulgaris TaxID=6087 RepID=T2M300_HYDVU|nr:30S ribosomal protein S18-like [Hydra vulgaris]